MSAAATVTETVIDVAADSDRLAHLVCAEQHPDRPAHALCGAPMLLIDAPADAPHCEDCTARMHAGGPIAAWIGALRCDEHAPTDRA